MCLFFLSYHLLYFNFFFSHFCLLSVCYKICYASIYHLSYVKRVINHTHYINAENNFFMTEK